MRHWESVICYEDRTCFVTSRWRLSGIATKQGAENTDAGLLWLQMSRAGDTVTADLFSDDGLAAQDKVATGTADGSACDGTGANAVELSLSEANSSGISGSLYIHAYYQDGEAPLQVALCVDEDLNALFDGIEDLPGYDATAGMAEYIRIAGDDVLAKVARMFADELGGYGAAEAWFLSDADRRVPDLRRIANPGQLRLACAYRALEIATGRSHLLADASAYSTLRDNFAVQYAQAMDSLTLAFTSGGDEVAIDTGSGTTHRLNRA